MSDNPATGERREGHSGLRVKDGKIEKFDPHPPWKWERGAMLPQSIEELEIVVNAALAAEREKGVNEFVQFHHNPIVAQLNQQLAAEREKWQRRWQSVTKVSEHNALLVDQLRAELAAAVEALRQIREWHERGTRTWAFADAALAKVKA